LRSAQGGLTKESNLQSGKPFAATFLLFRLSQNQWKALPPAGDIGKKLTVVQLEFPFLETERTTPLHFSTPKAPQKESHSKYRQDVR
jgi:hypothetical protein